MDQKSFPRSIQFFGDMHVVRYHPEQGVVMERARQSRSALLLGLFFSGGLIVIGVWLFWGKALEHHLAGRFSFVDWFLIAVGVVCAVFGGLVAFPLGARLMPRRIVTRHGPPRLALEGILRRRVWSPGETRLLRICGRGFLKRTNPETTAAYYTHTLVLIAEPNGWETRLCQTHPLPDSDASYGELYPFACYLAGLLEAPLEYRNNWDRQVATAAPKPDEV